MLQVCVVYSVLHIEEVQVLQKSAHFWSVLWLDCIALEGDLSNVTLILLFS
jgi:hypothetical protein